MPKTPENGWGQSYRVQFNVIDDEKIQIEAHKHHRSVPREIEYLAMRCLALEQVVKNYHGFLSMLTLHPEFFDADAILESIRRGEKIKQVG